MTPPRAGSLSRARSPAAGQSQAPGSAVPGGPAARPGAAVVAAATRGAAPLGASVPAPGPPPRPAQGGPGALHAASPGAAEPAGWLLRWRRKRRLRPEVRLRARGSRWGSGAARAGASRVGLGASGPRGDARRAQFADGSPPLGHHLRLAPGPRSSLGGTGAARRPARPPGEREVGSARARRRLSRCPQPHFLASAGAFGAGDLARDQPPDKGEQRPSADHWDSTSSSAGTVAWTS